MKQIAEVPLEQIGRLEIVVTGGRYSLEQVKAETGADLLLCGAPCKPSGAPPKGLKTFGMGQNPKQYLAGYGWTWPQDLRWTAEWELVDNFVAGPPLLVDGAPVERILYDDARSGQLPRSAMGLTEDALLLYCSNTVITPEQLRDELAGLGCTSAIMLDSGRGVQCDFYGRQVRSVQRIHNWIAVWK